MVSSARSPRLVAGSQRWLTWDEASAREVAVGPWRLADLAGGRTQPIEIAAGEDIEPVVADGTVGRLVRSRRALHGELHVQAEPVAADLVRISISITNTAADAATDSDAAIAASFIGAHLLVEVEHAEVLSMTDPPEDCVEAAAGCAQHRCWPVLAGPSDDSSLMLVSPIILYDHPEIAEQSAGALFDSTEIDEILTLRVMTLTDDEKAAARATDPRAGEIIDRCDAMSPEAMAALHGILRDPHAITDAVDLTSSFGFDGEVPWWDPAVDGAVSPDTDEVIINGVAGIGRQHRAGTPVAARRRARHLLRRPDRQGDRRAF